jgi:hypothetical protein
MTLRATSLLRWRLATAFCCFAATTASAQQDSSVVPIASLRLRAESWDWFDAGAEGRYAFGAAHLRLGAARETGRYGWRVEFASPALVGLPTDAVLPAPAGQLGLGAAYHAANDNRRAAIGGFAKQVFVRVGAASAARGHALRVGRFEFSDALEWTPRDPTLAEVRRTRVSQRLIGPFGFTHGQRSFDGAEYTHRTPTQGFTAVAFRPTSGVFDVDGSRSLNVDVIYAALNRSVGRPASPADLRLFVLRYDDRRGTVPVDSRPLAARQSGSRRIGVTSVGGHWTQRLGHADRPVDVMVWGVRQWGQWAGLTHGAGALAVEAGWRDLRSTRRPVVRVGVVRSSGDPDPTDDQHATFFQVLPTPRAYAPFPFHNLQNIEEVFVAAESRIAPRVTLRASAHGYRLRQGADLWTLGGGAFDAGSFGYAGRPANGATGLGQAVTVSAAWQPSPRLQFEVFAAQATGGDVTAASYGAARPARLVYLETTLRR